MTKPTIYLNHWLLTAVGWWLIVALAVSCGQGGQGTGPTASKEEMKQQCEQLRKDGKLARENSRFNEAIKLHTEGLKLARELGDVKEEIQALNNIGTNYRRLGILDEAAAYHHEALKLTMKAKDQNDLDIKRFRLVSLNGIGNVYMSLGDLEQADTVLRKALAGERDTDNKLGQAINLANLGKIKERKGEIDSAWVYYRYSLAMNRQVKSQLGEALCYQHFGNLHELSGDYVTALEEYSTAYDILKQTNDHWHRLETGVNVIRLFIKEGRMDEARELLQIGEETANSIKSLEHQSQIQYLYYQYYEKKGNAIEALNHYIRSSQLKDSIIDMRKVNQIQNMRISLDRMQQQTVLNQAQERFLFERKTHHITTAVLVLIVLLALSVIGGLWYTLRQRSETQRILQQMNKSREDFFASLAIDPADPGQAETVVNERDRQFLGKLVDTIYTQMAHGNTDVESVAERMGLSRAQLNRKVLAVTGQNTSSYMMQVRIAKAKRLLRADVNMPIGDIAAKCGFDDVAYFSRIFKQQTDTTPSQYRKMI